MYNHFMKEMGFGEFLFSFLLQAQVQCIYFHPHEKANSVMLRVICVVHIILKI